MFSWQLETLQKKKKKRTRDVAIQKKKKQMRGHTIMVVTIKILITKFKDQTILVILRKTWR